jgi:hypothetical protein
MAWGKNPMDTFEMMAKKMKDMKPQEQMEQMEKLKGMCLCPGCPTYTNCAKNAGESVFCSTGKSFMCIPNEVQCICPNCPVTKQMGLKYKQFCTRGAEKAQRYEHALWGTKMV